MSGPQRARRAKLHFKLPYQLAPWLALAAVTALWAKRPARASVPGESAVVLSPAEMETSQPGRGRAATAPWDIPPLGWKDIIWRTYREIGRARLAALAGGVTFYLLLATFPALAAFVSVYGLFSDVHSVEKQLGQLAAILPRDAVTLIGGQMVRLATQRHATLSAAFAASTLLSIWSANAGMKSLFDGINVAYDQPETRDYLHRTVITYGATFAGLVFLAGVSVLAVAAPVVLHRLGGRGASLWWAFRWLVVYLLAAAALSLIYRYGPSRVRARAKWRWVVPGGAAAALLWMAGSLGFSWYVNNFTHFGVTYGSLGAMVGFMLWVWFSVMVVLTGAEFSAEIEHQTACDTTTGTPAPIGGRGAVIADTVGKAFTVSPTEARHIIRDFLKRQAGHLAKILRLGVRRA
ncbi:MAG TPA: YihY/virulence factor BrkB family protein [Caulobacteraceae bacterium]